MRNGLQTINTAEPIEQFSIEIIAGEKLTARQEADIIMKLAKKIYESEKLIKTVIKNFDLTYTYRFSFSLTSSNITCALVTAERFFVNDVEFTEEKMISAIKHTYPEDFL